MLVLAWALLAAASAQTRTPAFRGLPGCDFCSGRQNGKFESVCCPSRRDDCSFPCFQSKCYCDAFCDRPDGGDCCPDYYGTCTATPRPNVDEGCLQDMREGETTKVNCNQCTCQRDGKLRCDSEVCMIQENVIDRVNNGRHSWKAGNHSAFWGKTLSKGRVLRTGTLDPSHSFLYLPVEDERPLPEAFDARVYSDEHIDMRYKIHITPDQGDCGSSWAVATASMASDRYAIFSEGRHDVVFSPQQLLDCVTSSRVTQVAHPDIDEGCRGGQVDRAWYYLKIYGGVTEECYDYTSGRTSETGQCETPRNERERHKLTISCPEGVKNEVHKTSPAYPVKNDTTAIKQEIRQSGPVQATLRVYEDFFMYKNGVYRHTNYHFGPGAEKWTYHSVKIIGWGVDRTFGAETPYWLCMNSWGPAWGEGGLFKIVAGENHCEIEQYVVASWGPQDVNDDKKRRKLRYRARIKKF